MLLSLPGRVSRTVACCRPCPGSACLLPQAWLTEIHEYAQRDVVIMLLGNKVSGSKQGQPALHLLSSSLGPTLPHTRPEILIQAPSKPRTPQAAVQRSKHLPVSAHPVCLVQALAAVHPGRVLTCLQVQGYPLAAVTASPVRLGHPPASWSLGVRWVPAGLGNTA